MSTTSFATSSLSQANSYFPTRRQKRGTCQTTIPHSTSGAENSVLPTFSFNTFFTTLS